MRTGSFGERYKWFLLFGLAYKMGSFGNSVTLVAPAPGWDRRTQRVPRPVLLSYSTGEGGGRRRPATSSSGRGRIYFVEVGVMSIGIWARVRLTSLPSPASSEPRLATTCQRSSRPVAVGSEVPTHRAGANSGVHYFCLEQRMRSAGLEHGPRVDLHRHHFRVRRNVKQLSAVAPPAWLHAAASGHQPFPAAGGWGKRNRVDLALAGLVGGVGEPMSVGRELPLVLGRRSLCHDKRLSIALYRN